jgi:hypothetical protein
MLTGVFKRGFAPLFIKSSPSLKKGGGLRGWVPILNSGSLKNQRFFRVERGWVTIKKGDKGG